MGTFKSEREFNLVAPDLAPVVSDITEHFQVQDFEVVSERTLTDGWQIRITKGGIFKTVVGLRSALKIELEVSDDKTLAKAGVGVFEQSAIPFAIGMLVFWPVLVTQIWGMVHSSKLDEEAMLVIQTSLKAHGRETSPSPEPGRPATPEATEAEKAYCTECGAALPAQARFCPGCGHQLA